MPNDIRNFFGAKGSQEKGAVKNGDVGILAELARTSGVPLLF